MATWMNDMNGENFEQHLHQLAASFQYPPTPDIASSVSRHLASGARDREEAREHQRPARLAWALVAILLILAALAAVPQVRAAVVEFFQVGAIRLFVGEATPTALPQTTAIPPAIIAPPTATPLAASSNLLPDLSGETTLEEAAVEIGRQMRLPTYPAGLRPPDRVFVQDLGIPVAILVWLERPDSAEVAFSLHVLPSSGGPFGVKSDVTILETTQVNGQEAYWVTGSHFLEYFDAQGRAIFDSVRLVEGNVLIWTDEDLTYRLETDMPLEEAIRTAESLR